MLARMNQQQPMIRGPGTAKKEKKQEQQEEYAVIASNLPDNEPEEFQSPRAKKERGETPTKKSIKIIRNKE